MLTDHRDEFAKLVEANRLIFVDGQNFSGRTDILRAATGLPVPNQGILSYDNNRWFSPCAYIGPEIYNAISGLTTSVRSELRLHAKSELEYSAAVQLMEETGLHGILDHNATILSGGEQAVVAAISAIAMKPKIIGVDCAFEQVDEQLRAILLNYIASGIIDSTCALVADNEPESLSPINAILPEALRGTAVHGKYSEGRYITMPDGPFRPDGTENEIALSGIGFCYKPGNDIFKNASCTIKAGYVYMLEGPNGSGKSTLAKILAGVLRATRGYIFLNNKKVDLWKQPGRVVSYHFQNPDMQLFSNTVIEEVTASLAKARLNVAEIDQQVRVYLKAFGLLGLEKENPFDLPFVLRKRLALAATLVSPSRFIILDEPTLGQDRNASNAMANIIRLLAEQGKSVIVISHSKRLKGLISYKSIRIEDRALSHE